MHALPDIGQQYDPTDTADSPGLNFTVQIDNPGSYTVWARGMAPDAAGDSLHVGVNDGTPTTAANLTGFAPNAWTWSRLTMSNTNATVDLSSSGTYTLNVWMAEDGLRLDKLLLVTDTATIPTGQGPLESPTTTALPNLGSHTIEYGYDNLYRLTDATYTGDITDTYEYEYNAVGNRTTYTATITTTTVTTYTYNAANQLVTAKEVGSPDIWHYVYDDNGNLVRQVPNGLTPADGEVRYTFNQRNLLVQIENHDGSSYLPQAEMKYDGAGSRLQSISFILGIPMTTTFTLDGLNNNLPLALDNGVETRNILYGLFGLGEFSTEWTYFLGDGQFSVRQLMDSNGNIALTRTYDPFGRVLQEAGDGNAIFGFAGAQSGGGGLLYINGRYYDPATGRFLSPDNNVDPMRPGTLNGYLTAIFLFGPVGAVIWRKRKKRNGKYDLMLFLVLGIGLGMLLVSCGESDEGNIPEDVLTPPPGLGTPYIPPQGSTPSSTPAAPTGTPTSTTTPTPNNPATPTPSPTPCPTPTNTPTPASIPWHYQNNKTVYPAVSLTEEEIRLTVVMTFSEGSNGTHSEESLRMLAWTYLNKKTIRMRGSDMYDVLTSMSPAWLDLGLSPDIRDEVGDMPPATGQAQRAWMLSVASMYYGSTTANGVRFQNKVDPIVRNAVSQWRTHGSNSAVDPTHGASSYSHQDDPLHHPSIEDRFDEIRSNFYEKALADPNFNYAISQPYVVSGRPTVLVVGPVEYWDCVAYGSCKP